MRLEKRVKATSWRVWKARVGSADHRRMVGKSELCFREMHLCTECGHWRLKGH